MGWRRSIESRSGWENLHIDTNPLENGLCGAGSLCLSDDGLPLPTQNRNQILPHHPQHQCLTIPEHRRVVVVLSRLRAGCRQCPGFEFRTLDGVELLEVGIDGLAVNGFLCGFLCLRRRSSASPSAFLAGSSSCCCRVPPRDKPFWSRVVVCDGLDQITRPGSWRYAGRSSPSANRILQAWPGWFPPGEPCQLRCGLGRHATLCQITDQAGRLAASLSCVGNVSGAA